MKPSIKSVQNEFNGFYGRKYGRNLIKVFNYFDYKMLKIFYSFLDLFKT